MSEEKLFGTLLTALRLERQKAARGDGDEEEEKKWSSEGVAKALGVSRQTYSGWENGHHLPKANDLRAIVKLFRLSDEERDALYRTAAQAPPIQEIQEPPIDNLPFQRNPFFTGREEELEQIRQQLQATGTATIAQPISISGLAGIGKTELALEYAHRFYPDVYRTVLWVDADTMTLQDSYANLAEVLKLPQRNEQELDRRIQAVKVWLKDHTNWLLIMDNADDLPLADSFLPAKPLGHVVFTTQSQIIGTIPKQIEIRAMEPADGQLLLLRRSYPLEGTARLNTYAADIRATALKVVELLDGHPLALDQAGAYIEGTGVSFADYIKRYRTERRRLLNRRRSRKSKYSDHSRHPLPVTATLKLSFKEACEEHPLASDILHFCAFLYPDTIPEELFQHDDSFKFDTTEFDEAIEALHSYSLIKRNTQEKTLSLDRLDRLVQEKTLSLHRLVQTVLIDVMPPDLQRQWRERVVRSLNAAFPEINTDNWIPGGRYVLQALVCSKWTEDELSPTVDASELFHKAGVFLRYIDLYSEAESLLVRAHSIKERQLGAKHPATIKSLLDLAVLYRKQGKYGQTESLCQRAISIWENHLGAEYPDIAFDIYWLQILSYEMEGKHEQADALYQHALSILEQRFGATNGYVKSIKSAYAVVSPAAYLALRQRFK